jgi:hypothetical protein
MKKLYTYFFLIVCYSILFVSRSGAQCTAGYSASQLNWDNLDYFITTGSYSGFVTNPMASSQRFAIGPNGVTISASTSSFTLSGENTTHTGNLTNFAGNDVQYTPTVSGDSVVISFDTEVQNLSLALYDVDNLANYTISARNAAGAAVGVNITLQGVSILTVGGVPTLRTVTANNTALANTSNAGSAIISTVAGAVVKTLKIVITSRGNDPVFWMSDLNACVTGSFPNNWRNISRPFTGQAAYIITVVDSQFLLLDPATGYAKPFFKDAGNNSVNGVAYDPVNRVVYYVYNRSGAGGVINPNNKTIRRYFVDAEIIDTAVANVTTSLNIPTFDNGVESAAASFHGGYYYFGIEGYNGARNSGRENTIWRIEFDATLNATRASQVYSTRADSNNRLRHDWSDIAVSNNAMMYDFDGAGGDEMYYHFNLMTGERIEFVPSGPGSTRPTQTGVDWAENVFNAGNSGGLSGTGFVVPYNYNGTVNSAQEYQVFLLPGPTYPSGNWSDCGEAIRPLCDFGDAPASYDPDPWSPAVHEKDTAIRLGATWDREWLKMTPMDATGDGSDEDALLFVPPYFLNSGSYLTPALVYNNTGEPARIVAWIDFNGNGTFDASEACQTVAPIPSMPAMQSVNLYWPGVTTNLTLGSFTYLRIRLVKASTGMSAANATGFYDHGETEDYRIVVENTPLTARLLSFDAKKTGNKVELKWTSTEENGLDNYYIEKRPANGNWSIITQVAARGNGIPGIHQYNFLDEQPFEGTSYYRLKLVSVDGRSQYSAIRSIRFENGISEITIIPNPAQNKTRVTLYANNTERLTLHLIDITGRTVWQSTETVQQGVHAIEIPLAGKPPGSYVLRVQQNGQTLSRIIIVE